MGPMDASFDARCPHKRAAAVRTHAHRRRALRDHLSRACKEEVFSGLHRRCRLLPGSRRFVWTRKRDCLFAGRAGTMGHILDRRGRPKRAGLRSGQGRGSRGHGRECIFGGRGAASGAFLGAWALSMRWENCEMGRLGGEGGSRGWRKIDEGVHVDSRRRGDSLVFSRDAFGFHVRIRRECVRAGPPCPCGRRPNRLSANVE